MLKCFPTPPSRRAALGCVSRDAVMVPAVFTKTHAESPWRMQPATYRFRINSADALLRCVCQVLLLVPWFVLDVLFRCCNTHHRVLWENKVVSHHQQRRTKSFYWCTNFVWMQQICRTPQQLSKEIKLLFLLFFFSDAKSHPSFSGS